MDNKMTAEQALERLKNVREPTILRLVDGSMIVKTQTIGSTHLEEFDAISTALSAPRVPMATDAMIYRGAEWLHDHGMRIDGDPIDAAEQMEKIAEGVFEAMLTASPEPVAPAAGGSWEEETHS